MKYFGWKSDFSKTFNAITYVGIPDITSRFNKGADVQLDWNKIEGNKTFIWMNPALRLLRDLNLDRLTRYRSEATRK